MENPHCCVLGELELANDVEAVAFLFLSRPD